MRLENKTLTKEMISKACPEVSSVTCKFNGVSAQKRQSLQIMRTRLFGDQSVFVLHCSLFVRFTCIVEIA